MLGSTNGHPPESHPHGRPISTAGISATMHKLPLAAVVLCGLVACRSDNVFDGRYVRVDKPSAIALCGSSIACDIPGAVDGFAVDSSYIFYTMQHPEHRFVVCDPDTMEPLQSLVHVGRGPGEYNYLQCNGRFTRDSSGLGVWFYSAQKQESARLNLTRSRAEGETRIDNRLTLDERALSEQTGFSGQLFAFDRTNDSVALFQIIRDTRVLRGLCDFKNRRLLGTFDFDAQSRTEPNLTGGPIDVRPDAKRVVMLPMYFDQINLCDADGSNRISVSTRKKTIALSQVENCDRSERKTYYLDVQTTPERIIALYRNHETQTRELHLFDWGGRLLHVLTLNRPVRSLSLQTPTGILYGFVSPEEVCKMNLAEWL